MRKLSTLTITSIVYPIMLIVLISGFVYLDSLRTNRILAALQNTKQLIVVELPYDHDHEMPWGRK